jgi:hypothetical protein
VERIAQAEESHCGAGADRYGRRGCEARSTQSPEAHFPRESPNDLTRGPSLLSKYAAALSTPFTGISGTTPENSDFMMIPMPVAVLPTLMPQMIAAELTQGCRDPNMT